MNSQNNNNRENLAQDSNKPQKEDMASIDNTDIDKIKGYYNLLSAGKLKEAYAMRAIKDIFLTNFQNGLRMTVASGKLSTAFSKEFKPVEAKCR